MGGGRRYRSEAGRTGRWGRVAIRGRLAVITTALSVLTSLVLVPEAAGAAAQGPTGAARELVADEVVGSPQVVSLTPDNLGIAMWSVPDGTTLIGVSREVDRSKVSDLAFTDSSTSGDMPGLRLPGEVRDVTFGPDSTAYLTVAHPDDQTAGWLLRLGPADSSATVLHTWPVDPVERYREPYSVEYANDRLVVEALSANTIHSCLPQLEAFDLAGTPVGTFEATTCGGLWQADDGLVFASDTESYGGLFVDPATGASHRVGFPSPGPIWNRAHGPGGRIAVVTGNGHNRCETGFVSVIDPSGVLLSRPLHEVFGVASDAQCLVRALTLLDNGSAVVGADLLGIGAALYMVAPDGSSKQIWTSPTQTIRSLHAAAGNAFVMVSTSADACGLPHLENCGRVHVRVGTDAGVRPPASFGGEYGDSRTAPFELVSIGRNDVVVVSQRNQCLCSDPDNEYVLDRVGAPGIERQSWHDPAGAGSPPPSTLKYVALGDSIAAGEGQGDADGYPNNASAYPAILATHLNADVYNLAISGACSATAGATSPGIGTAHRSTAESCKKSVLNTQLPQLLELGVQPDIITLTVGGNDIQFAECFQAEAGLTDDENPCRGQIFLNRLAALRANVRQVLAFLSQHYPDASVFITTQYNPLPGDTIDSEATPCAQMPLLYVIDRIRAGRHREWAEALLFGELDSKGLQFQFDLYAKANRVIGRINKSLRITAEEYGATVVPLDFTGHDFCRGYDEAGQSWVLSPNIRLSVDVERRLNTESFERFYTPLEKCTPLPDCNGFSKVDGGSFSLRFVLTGHYQYTFVANDFPHLTVAGAKAVARILHSNIQP